MIQRPMKKYAVYKPNKRLAGAAFQFDFNPAKESVFIEAANQTGEQLFDWGNKVIVKLSDTDIAKLLTVLEGKKPTVELFHDSTKTSKPLTESAPAAFGPPKPAFTPMPTGSAPLASTSPAATPVASLKSTTVSLTKGDYGFFIKATRQFSDGKVAQVNMPLSDDEAITLRVLFQRALGTMYGW